MNSLPLNPEIVMSNKPATIIFYEVLPVAEFANCMYWHDIEDKSLISLGKVKINRVYHSTYKGFTDRTCADDFSLVHFSGAFVAAADTPRRCVALWDARGPLLALHGDRDEYGSPEHAPASSRPSRPSRSSAGAGAGGHGATAGLPRAPSARGPTPRRRETS